MDHEIEPTTVYQILLKRLLFATAQVFPRTPIYPHDHQCLRDLCNRACLQQFWTH